ncbi:MAG: class I SAM-dependent methyltransferase [Mycobacteriales bacterium]
MTVGPDEEAERRASAYAARALAAGDPTGWFEPLYSDGKGVPWDRGGPNPLLSGWPAPPATAGATAVVVGAGLGYDAEYVAGLGYATTGFDISPAAVARAREIHPGSSVGYAVGDLLALPAAWRAAYDLVVEIHTVQALPDPLRVQAIAGVRSLVAPGGALLVIAAGREPDDPLDPPPWPLTRAEVESFARDGLVATGVEDIRDVPRLGARRFRATFRRAGP